MPESPRDRGLPAPDTHEKKGSSSKLLLSIPNILALSRAAAGDADRLENDVTRRGRDASQPPPRSRRFPPGCEGGARRERRSVRPNCFPIGHYSLTSPKRGVEQCAMATAVNTGGERFGFRPVRQPFMKTP